MEFKVYFSNHIEGITKIYACLLFAMQNFVLPANSESIQTQITNINNCMRFEKGWGCKEVFFKTNVTLGCTLASVMKHYKGGGIIFQHSDRHL